MVFTARARVRESAGNLPTDVTSFVGRRHELTLIKRLFAEARIVTLTGPGGVGKTRLAMRVAAGMRRNFRDKAWYVTLEHVLSGSLVADAVIEQLGIGSPSAGEELSTLIEQLKQREMLLVLDNCEHVIEHAAELVDAIVRWCPGVRVLATSRQSLGVAGESTVVVPPLQVPDPEQLPPAEAYEQYASVRLFVERAKSAVPEFEVTGDNADAVMKLVHHLDGNPLAIELAAVRLRSMSPQQLEERLAERYDLLTEGRRGAPARQQTLRALIDWSYELLSDSDRLAWARMSVFAGSFDLDAAEHVVGGGQEGSGALTAIHSLIDKSVLLREEDGGDVRFRLPHTLREYGQDKLAEFGERDAMRQRHCAWYAELTDRFGAEWIGPEQAEWVNLLRSEHGNLRAAMQTAGAKPETADTALRMSVQLWSYWGIRGLNSEAKRWIDEMLAAAPAGAPNRARALRTSAWFSVLQGEPDRVDALLAEAAELATHRGDDLEHAYITLVRGMTEYFRQNVDTATELVADALERFRASDDLVGVLFGLYGLGSIKGLSRDFDVGLALLKECIQLTTGYGELYWRSYALWAKAQVEMLRDDLDRADAAVKEALRLQRRLDNRLGSAFSLDTLAWIAQRQGRHERAAQLFGAAAAVWDGIRAAPGFWVRFSRAHEVHEQQTREAIGEEAFQEAFDRGREMSLSRTADFALEIKPHTKTRAEDSTPLTRRERQIAELVAQGQTNKEIAENLVIAQRTVEGHVQNILTKLDFSSRTQIAGWYAGQRHGDPDDTDS